MTDKTICRNDGRCEYAVQTGAEKEGGCPAGACAMPCTNPAAHLTIPGALEWDGDNGTHGVVGTHSADGESALLAAAGEHVEEHLSKQIDILTIDLNSARAKLGERDALLAKCKNWIEAAREGVLYPIANEFQGVVGHNAEGLGQLSVALLEALSAVANPVRPAEEDPFAATEAPYVPLSAAEVEAFMSMGDRAKPKTCIECDQPYCHGVCVERGDQDYDRDQAAKGGGDE
jgi:hypothetical protein